MLNVCFTERKSVNNLQAQSYYIFFCLIYTFLNLLTLFFFCCLPSLLVRVWKEFHSMGHCNVHRHVQGNAKRSPALPPHLPLPPTKFLSLQLKPWVRCDTRKELIKQYSRIWNFLWSNCKRQANELLLPSRPAVFQPHFTLAIQHGS